MTPASIRYWNPGAMWPGPSSQAFGSTGYETLRDGNRIAVFPDAESGGAAQFHLLNRKYTGKRLSDAISEWSGGNSSPAYIQNISRATGLSPDTVLTADLFRDPTRAIPFAKAMAQHEAGRAYPMDDNAWGRAHARFLGAPASSSPSSSPSVPPPTAGPRPMAMTDFYSGDSPEEVERKRKIASALMAQGTSAAPVGHWTQALARVMQGGMGGFYDQQAAAGEKAGRASVTQALMSGTPQEKMAALSRTPWGQDMASKLAMGQLQGELDANSPMGRLKKEALELELQGKRELRPLEIEEKKAAIQAARDAREMEQRFFGGAPSPASGGNIGTQAPAVAPVQSSPSGVPGVVLGSPAPSPTTGAIPAAAPTPQPAPAAPVTQESVRDTIARMPENKRLALWKAWREKSPKFYEMLDEFTNPNKEQEKARQKELGEQQAKREAEGLPLSPTVKANIQGGLRELYGIPDRYGGDSGVFGSAVGAFQGDPNSWILGPIARALGSLKTLGNEKAPAEVRRAIQGATDTVASVIKPLIRKPGEGTWSDADQARLNMIVGELAQANDVAQYRRELDNVRRRINANFNLELPPLDQVAERGATQGGPRQAPDGNWYVPDPDRPGKYLKIER